MSRQEIKKEIERLERINTNLWFGTLNFETEMLMKKNDREIKKLENMLNEM